VRGSVVKRGEGYSVVVDLDRDPITRKRRQRWHSGYRTKREAERALSEIIASVHAGSYIEPTKQTLREFTSEWLAAIEPTIRLATHCSYSRNLRMHVLPRLGSVQLRRIDGGMLNTVFYAGWVVATHGAVRAHHRAPRPQGCSEVGKAGPEPCRRGRPAQSERS
jgi:hypothetical protein